MTASHSLSYIKLALLINSSLVSFPSSLSLFVSVFSLQKDDHPGLGESEVIYSIAVAMYSVGELVGSLSSASLSLSVGHSVLFFSGVVLQTFAFLFYGLSNAGWMVIVARLLLGLHGGLILALPPSYFSVSVEEYIVLKEAQEGKRNNGLKKQLIFFWGFIATFGVIVVTGMCVCAHACVCMETAFIWCDCDCKC